MALLFAVISQTEPGPLDAFKANYASIKAELDFEYIDGSLNNKQNHIWASEKIKFTQDPKTGLIGRWACDGSVEFHRFQSTEAVLALARLYPPRQEARKRIFTIYTVPKTEALWDGQILASTTRQAITGIQNPGIPASREIGVTQVDQEPRVLLDGRSPFYWGFSYTFPQMIKAKFRDARPVRRQSIRGSHLVEVEIYEAKHASGGLFRLEVSYDPTIGYLPRFARILSIGSTGDALAKEMYLVDARPCSAGGFVPVEWYGTLHILNKFNATHPNYNDDTEFQTSDRIPCGHFRATSFRDFREPASLEDVQDITTLNTPGGWVPIQPRGQRVSLSTIKRIAGTRLTNPKLAPVLPNLDATELYAHDPSPDQTNRWSRWPVLFGITGIALTAYYIGRRRHTRTAALLLTFTLTGQLGCNNSLPSITKINAAFKSSHVYQTANSPDIRMTLVLRNDGN